MTKFSISVSQIIDTFRFIEEIEEKDGLKNIVRASFIINVGLINRTNEKIVLDKLYLSFETNNFWRRYRQKLLRIAFPSRPRKIIGTGVKFMGVFFTEYLEEDGKFDVVTGRLEPKENCGGYLLFVSFTYGDWNPKIKNNRIMIKLNGILTSGEKLTSKAAIRIERSKEVIEEFVPGITEHVAHESTWNHDLSEVK